MRRRHDYYQISIPKAPVRALVKNTLIGFGLAGAAWGVIILAVGAVIWILEGRA